MSGPSAIPVGTKPLTAEITPVGPPELSHPPPLFFGDGFLFGDAILSADRLRDPLFFDDLLLLRDRLFFLADRLFFLCERLLLLGDRLFFLADRLLLRSFEGDELVDEEELSLPRFLRE